MCKYIVVSKTFKDNDGTEFSTKGEINCKAENLVYGVRCERCNKLLYVGETMNSLYKRHTQNLSRIDRRNGADAITQHFTEGQHTKEDYKIVGIEKIERNDNYRKTREQFWITKLKTLKPVGLNTKTS